MAEIIYTDRLALRLFNRSSEDYALVLETLKDGVPHTPGEAPPKYPRTQEDLDKRLARQKLRDVWTKVPVQSQMHLVFLGNECIGVVHVAERWKFPDLGWLIRLEYQGQGFATEAARAALNFWHSTVGISKLYAAVHMHHRASERIAEKIGLKFTSYFIVNREDGTTSKLSAYMLPGMEAFPDGYEIDERTGPLVE